MPIILCCGIPLVYLGATIGATKLYGCRYCGKVYFNPGPKTQ